MTEERSTWVAKITIQTTLHEETKRFRVSLAWVATGLIICTAQFISKGKGSMLAVLTNAFSAGFWSMHAWDHYSLIRRIKALIKADKEEDIEDSSPIDPKEIEELKKITGME